MSGLTTATYITLATTALTTVGTVMQSMEARGVAKTNQAIAENQALSDIYEAEAAADDRARIARQTQGAARNSAGANTGSVEGSALDILADNAATDELDILRIEYSGQSAADASAFEAQLQGNKAKSAGFDAAVGVGAGLIKGYGQYNAATTKAAT